MAIGAISAPILRSATRRIAGSRAWRTSEQGGRLLVLRATGEAAEQTLPNACFALSVSGPVCCTIRRMPNIASAFKAEVIRLARKEIRGEIASLKKAVVACRSEIAALKRRTQALEQHLRR